jgi:hypothetical protein
VDLRQLRYSQQWGEYQVVAPRASNQKNLAMSMRIAVDTLCDAFAAGSVAEDLAPVLEPVRIGLGQSLGGHLVVVCEGQHAVFDRSALLGVSRHHTKMSSAPGTVLAEPSYLPRGTNIGGLAPENYIRAAPEVASNGRAGPSAPGARTTTTNRTKSSKWTCWATRPVNIRQCGPVTRFRHACCR